MSALGQKQTFRSAMDMSALPPKEDATTQDKSCPLAQLTGGPS